MLQFRAHMSTWWQSHRHSDIFTDTQNVSLIFIHTFPLHRPVVHVVFSLFPAVKQCDRSPCGHGATCQEAPGGFQCLCPPGWTGRTCQLGQWDLTCIIYIQVQGHCLRMPLMPLHILKYEQTYYMESLKTQWEYALLLNK